MGKHIAVSCRPTVFSRQSPGRRYPQLKRNSINSSAHQLIPNQHKHAPSSSVRSLVRFPLQHVPRVLKAHSMRRSLSNKRQILCICFFLYALFLFGVRINRQEHFPRVSYPHAPISHSCHALSGPRFQSSHTDRLVKIKSSK